MTQTFFLGQLRLALVAIIAYAGGKGWLTPTDAGLATALITSLGPLIGPWAWSIYANVNSKLVPQHSVVIDPVVTSANSSNATATVQTAAGTMTGKVVGVLLAAFLLSTFLAIPSAQAQTPLRRQAPVLNLPVDPLHLNGTPVTGDVGNDLLKALDSKLLPDLQYALLLAKATGSNVTAPCWQAWIDMINTQLTAVKNADGTDIVAPDPHLVTTFERMVELRNALQPDSKFMTSCSPVANLVKQDVIKFMGIVISGGAGLATLIPAL